MRIIKKRIVGALLISKDNHILLGYKDPKWGGRYSDCWVIPGGAVDKGESDLAALHREIREEVDLDISPYESILIDDTLTGENKTIHNVTGEPVTFKMQFLDYLTKIPKLAKDIPVTAKDDIAKAEWVPFGKLQEYTLSPSLSDLLKHHGYLVFAP
jgi:8-oxo-dGTP pyrophosphatase MutT (NUDIX family)